jgi:hypothetical protein
MSNNSQMTLFQHETGAGPARALMAASIDNSLGEGIRSSYAILSIKASRWRLKYKKNETVLQAHNPNTNRMEPIPSLEMVIVKANGFLNKQYYKGKYVEGSNSPPDCYSLDGKTPSASVKAPVHSNCAMCPMNQFGSLIGDNGVKQKACRDTKKLAVVPLADLRNESFGGPMLFRVPPSSLGDLSKMADALKARGFPYNAVAVRFTFALEASHPKPQFNAIRALTDEEAEVVLELYNSDGTAAVLADNDIVVELGDKPKEAPVNDALFEQPTVAVGPQAAQPAPMAQPVQQAPAFAGTPPAPVAAAAPVAEAATRLVSAFAPPPPPGGMTSVVQPYSPNAAPPPMSAFAPPGTPAQPLAPQPAAPAPAAVQGNPFAAAAQEVQAPVAAKKPRAKTPPVQVPEPAPVAAEVNSAPPQGQLDDDVNNILAGLSAFTGGAK